MYLQLMLVQELELELGQELGLGLELVLESGLQQGQDDSDWTGSKETETLCGWVSGWVWGWPPSLFGRHNQCSGMS